MNDVIEFPQQANAEDPAVTDMPEVMSPQYIAGFFGVSMRSVERWRESGEGPECFRLPGERSIRYHREDVQLWLAGLRAKANKKPVAGTTGQNI